MLLSYGLLSSELADAVVMAGLLISSEEVMREESADEMLCCKLSIKHSRACRASRQIFSSFFDSSE